MYSEEINGKFLIYELLHMLNRLSLIEEVKIYGDEWFSVKRALDEYFLRSEEV